MKTIEEREREYAENTWPNDPEKQTSARLGYRAGASAEHAELTRWNDPKEVLSEDGCIVLTWKAFGNNKSAYMVACYDAEFKMWITPYHAAAVEIGYPLSGFTYRPDGWRKIE